VTHPTVAWLGVLAPRAIGVRRLFVARTTIVFGGALIVLGIVGYTATGAVSITALIPAFFGAVLVVLGWFGQNERYRKHAVRLATAIGIVGLLGSVRGVTGLMDLISGGEVQRPAAVISQSMMAILMVVFVGLCVRWLMGARPITRPE
jgi:hypothetical protein